MTGLRKSDIIFKNKNMSTRSLIAQKKEDGDYTYIYCHFDGYPEYNGAILKECYTEQERVTELLNLGSLRSLRKTIESTKTYNKDYEEEDLYLSRAKDKRKLLKDFKSSDAQYLYIFDNGSWDNFYKKRYLPDNIMIVKDQLK